jgi:flavin-dependent dehydrogenase
MYDVAVVGARCAGSPTAMLLARKGYRVLLMDKAAFPSDTMSSHCIHPPGIARLKRWGSSIKSLPRTVHRCAAIVWISARSH